jgi:5-methylcytosine-specific restriction endonuclease McrBC GTP-binding regulatory subunit McrB
MNTADRSIALVDLALRRRFYFFDMYPDAPPVDNVLRAWLQENAEEFVWLAELLEIANEHIGDRHVAIGPSYFMRDELDEDTIQDVWEHSIIPYLTEHFFGDEARLAKFELPLLQGQAERRMAGDGAS